MFFGEVSCIDNVNNRCMGVNYSVVKSMKNVLIIDKMNNDIEL